MNRAIPVRHDKIILGSDLPKEEQVEVEVVAVDTTNPEAPLYTCYDAREDCLLVLIISKNGRFHQVQFQRAKEPWES